MLRLFHFHLLNLHQSTLICMESAAKWLEFKCLKERLVFLRYVFQLMQQCHVYYPCQYSMMQLFIWQEELKSSEDFQPSSKCCKEIADFVTENSDPLLPMRKKNRKSCCLWKLLRRMRCSKLSWFCCWCCDCFSGCCNRNRKQNKCKCSSCLQSINFSLTNWCYCYDKKSHCCKHLCGCNNCCCILPGCNFRWPFSCCFCKCSCSCTCPSFPKVPSCCGCTKC
ncbi:hypothetical protein RYX36_002669 [Vicia faba]